VRGAEGITGARPGKSSDSTWLEGSKNYIRNVEAVGSNPITSTKKVQFNGLRAEPGRAQIPRERPYRSLGLIVIARWTEFTMTSRQRTRGMRGAGTIAKRPDGRWRLRVSINGRQVTYGTYSTEDQAADAQARWRATRLLPVDDPEQAVELPARVAVGGVRCDEWFVRWQKAKEARRSRVRVNIGERSPQRRVTGPIGRSGGHRRSA
jgi:hypothetical protein